MVGPGAPGMNRGQGPGPGGGMAAHDGPRGPGYVERGGEPDRLGGSDRPCALHVFLFFHEERSLCTPEMRVVLCMSVLHH